jgi:hypothetical protein
MRFKDSLKNQLASLLDARFVAAAAYAVGRNTTAGDAHPTPVVDRQRDNCRPASAPTAFAAPSKYRTFWRRSLNFDAIRYLALTVGDMVFARAMPD